MHESLDDADRMRYEGELTRQIHDVRPSPLKPPSGRQGEAAPNRLPELND